jgi:hypothetical protein
VRWTLVEIFREGLTTSRSSNTTALAGVVGECPTGKGIMGPLDLMRRWLLD